MRTTRYLALFMAAMLLALLFAGCAKSDNGTREDTAPQVSAETGTSPVVEISTPPVAQASAPAGTEIDAIIETDDVDDYEEGTSPADDIVNTTPADKVLLVVSFGTSFNQSRSLTIGGIEAAMKEAYPDYQIRRAFTSQIIINKLAAREGLRIDNVEDAMNRLVLDKVREVVIQPTTVMNGYEFDDVIAEVMPFADKFESFKIGKQLLCDDIDYSEVAEIIVQETLQYRADDTAIVLMGHGTEHDANVTYAKFQSTLTAKGYDDYIVGTVEAEPTLEDVQEMLKEMGVKKVVLRPLMIVAGDHANNDMAGDEEDSWKTILTEDGYIVETVIEGLGQVKAIQELFIRHVRDAIDSQDLSITLADTAVGVTAARIQNGIYSIEVDTDSSMFKIIDCQLTVENDSMTAEITMSGQGYEKTYIGSVEQALADSGINHIDYKDVDGKRVFNIPVAALDRDISCAALGDRSGTWYDHVIVFESTNMPGAAFLPCMIDAAMIGGSGRAGIESPANLFYRGGENIAEIVWSSPNYTYMLVNGVEYLPVNTGGNSTFEIPVKLDTDIAVTACTVAMSEPREIDYTLYFDSSSIH